MAKPPCEAPLPFERQGIDYQHVLVQRKLFTASSRPVTTSLRLPMITFFSRVLPGSRKPIVELFTSTSQQSSPCSLETDSSFTPALQVRPAPSEGSQTGQLVGPGAGMQVCAQRRGVSTPAGRSWCGSACVAASGLSAARAHLTLGACSHPPRDPVHESFTPDAARCQTIRPRSDRPTGAGSPWRVLRLVVFAVPKASPPMNERAR